MRPALEMVAHLGVVDVDDQGVLDLVQGRRVATDAGPELAGEVAVRDGRGVLVCVATRDHGGVLRPGIVMATGTGEGDD